MTIETVLVDKSRLPLFFGRVSRNLSPFFGATNKFTDGLNGRLLLLDTPMICNWCQKMSQVNLHHTLGATIAWTRNRKSLTWHWTLHIFAHRFSTGSYILNLFCGPSEGVVRLVLLLVLKGSSLQIAITSIAQLQFKMNKIAKCYRVTN